jgi:hypothetical protein
MYTQMLNNINRIKIGDCSICGENTFLLPEYNLKNDKPNPWDNYVCIRGEECTVIVKDFFDELENEVFDRMNNIYNVFKYQGILPEFAIEQIVYNDAVAHFAIILINKKQILDKILNNNYNLGYCWDCGKYGLVRKVDACVHDMNNECCVKFICDSYCCYICPNKHWNEVSSEVYDISCYCKAIIDMKPNNGDGSPFGGFSWWGISPDEHYRRYGY